MVGDLVLELFFDLLQVVDEMKFEELIVKKVVYEVLKFEGDVLVEYQELLVGGNMCKGG